MTDFAIPGLMTPSSPNFDASALYYDVNGELTLADTYPTTPIYLESAWAGIPTLIMTVNDVTPADDLASVKIIFFSAEHGPECPALVLESPDDITIIDANLWSITVPVSVLDLGRGKWYFRLSTLSTAGADSAQVRLVGNQIIL